MSKIAEAAKKIQLDWYQEHPGATEPDSGDVRDMIEQAIRLGLSTACKVSEEVSESTNSGYPRDAKQMGAAIRERICEVLFCDSTARQLDKADD